MEIKEISVSQMAVIIEEREPIGLFYHEECSDLFTGIDNSTGDAWIEQFRTLEKCLRWLNRIEEELPMDIEEKQLIIYRHYRFDHQLDRLAEECAELIKSIMKYKRGDFTETGANYFEEMIGEMADVSNLLEQFGIAIPQVKESIERTKTYKVDREIERINGRKSNRV